MIEICFNHKIQNGTLFIDKLSIGHGLPTHGQLDFISLITEEYSQETGEILFATLIWGYGWWKIKNYKIIKLAKTIIDKIKLT
jgi:hypothetical protein